MTDQSVLTDNAQRSIPCIIHQTWKDNNIPQSMRSWQSSWQKHHPSWEYRLWTDEDNYRLVAEYYPWLLPVYEGFSEPVMRVDLVRCLILKHYGGVYADLDFECLKPVVPLLEGFSLVLGCEPQSHAQRWNDSRDGRYASAEDELIVSNAWMASTAEHPFWDAVIAQILSRRSLPNAAAATGPFAITAAWRSDRWQDASLLAAPVLFPITASEAKKGQLPQLSAVGGEGEQPYAVHHWAGTWWRGKRFRRLLTRFSQQFGRSAVNTRQRGILVLKKIKRRLFRLLGRDNRGPLYQPQPAVPGRELSKAELAQRVMIAVPVKNAARFIPGFVDLLKSLDYPHENLSLVFLESDSSDDSSACLQKAAAELRNDYRSVSIFSEDFGYRPVAERNSVGEQLRRRAILARSRNQLIRKGLQDEDWVLWIDVDVQWWPPQILHCLLAENRDMIVPNCLTPYGDDFDLNTFKIKEGMTAADWQPWLRDGLLQPPKGFGRHYLNELRDHHCVQIDGVGATMLLVRAKLHREGILFPEAPYRNYIETEGLSMLAADRGYSSWGLPGAEIIHPLY